MVATICRFVLTFLIVAVALNGCDDKLTQPKPPEDLLERLTTLPGVTATEIDVPEGDLHSRAFAIEITQPVDHENLSAGTFQQHMFLLHADPGAPMVLVVTGYEAVTNFAGEAAQILSANQIYVSHRYIGESTPNPVDWTYLTVAQAAADHHRVVETFKHIYSGPWVSYGASKGGQAALIHRRFYPDDVEVTIARVAPIVFGVEDPRFDEFLTQTVATEECREKYRQFQIRCLDNRDRLMPYLQDRVDNGIYSYSISLDSAFEYSVLEYPFAFFQAGSGNCEDIPDIDATYEEMFTALMRESGIEIFSDELSEYYAPVFYQMYTELGYYRLIDDHLKDHLEVLGDPSYSRFAPEGVELTFHPEVVPDIAQWLQTQGHRIIYLYGAVDPWSAAAVALGGNVDALKIVEPGANHSVRIATLRNPDPVFDKLEEWLGVEIDRQVIAKPVVEPVPPGARL